MKNCFILMISALSLMLVGCNKEDMTPPNFGTCYDQPLINGYLSMSDITLKEAATGPGIGFCKLVYDEDYKDYELHIDGRLISFALPVYAAISTIRDRLKRCGCGL